MTSKPSPSAALRTALSAIVFTLLVAPRAAAGEVLWQFDTGG